MISLATAEEKNQILQDESSSAKAETEATENNESCSLYANADTEPISADDQETTISASSYIEDIMDEADADEDEKEDENEVPPKIAEDSVEGLLKIAKEAQDQAQKASLAAQNAAETVRRTVIDTDFPTANTADRLRQMQFETIQKALLAAQASLEAQESAYEASAAAFSKAQNAVELSKTAREQVQAQREKLSLKFEEAEEIAETAAEEAEIANYKAKETAEKKDAYHAAYLASKTMEEEAAAIYEKNQHLLAEAEQRTEEIYLDLLSLRNMEMLLKQQITPPEQEMITVEPVQEIILEQPEEIAEEPIQIKETKTKTKTKTKNKKSGAALFFSYLKVILLALLIALLLRTYVFEVTKVDGDSMLPDLQDGNSLITSKINYRIWEPQRGDIVIVEAPDRYNEFYIKRIIGLPNERITIKDGKVYINSSLLSEPYLPEGTETNGEIDMLIESNAYFVMGDNRNASHDSRSSAVGTIGINNIKGKAVFRVYPPSEIGLLD